ncbi:MAG: homoserine dehydrogenase [Cyanobacteria bacterium HKST-UBA05]|nr:homoserine dehydrogenase [Cyanobacteria bacterium HKST-UBA05]
MTTQTQTCSSEEKATIGIGLLGLGTVGTGVYKLVNRTPGLDVIKIAVRDPGKERPGLLAPDQAKLTTHVDEVLEHPDVAIVVELMGGMDEAYRVIKQALSAGKHVVTANKMVIAHHGPELFALANAHQVNLLFEGAVAGGIPIVLPLKVSLAANRIEQIAGILNGTTNYILTRMEQDHGLAFETALADAQHLGFAEADPTADVEGHDAACKIAILGSLAFGKPFSPKDVYTEGIARLTPADMAMADELGYRIRLLALAKPWPSSDNTQGYDIRVHPMLVPADHPLAKVTFENNAIWVQGDAVGETMFYGKGAGELPTASAVSGDINLVAASLASHQYGQPCGGHPTQHPGMRISFASNTPHPVVPIAETTNAYYIRLTANDVPGVMGALGMACGDCDVSLHAVLQKGTDEATNSASIVLLTHCVQEGKLQAALDRIRALPQTRDVQTVLRVFDSI